MRTRSVVLTLAFALTATQPADAQISRLRRAAQRAVENEVGKKIATVVGEAVACPLGDRGCVDQARQNGDKVVMVDDEGKVVTDENGNPVADPDVAAATKEKPGEGRWANYDYLRGERPIYNTRWNIEDTESPPALKPNPSVRVGRIPGNVDFKSGNMEIVQIDGLNTAEFKDETYFRVPLAEPLPEDFSLELTLQLTVGTQYVYVYFEPVQGEGIDISASGHHYLELWNSSSVLLARNRVSGTDGNVGFIQQLTPVKFQVDDGYAILYVGGTRVAQVPNFKHAVGSTAIEFEVHARTDIPIYIRDIRVDYGVEDPVSVLEAEGVYTTRSIFFDTNSATLRPESTPELERVRALLEAHGKPAIIEGHTDSVGSDEYNLELSGRRAEAVKAYLVGHGIDAALIQSVGKGEADPIADNGTDEGRQANRRVVIKPAT